MRESKEMFDQRVQLTNSISPAVASSLMKPFYKVSRNNNVTKKYDFKDEKINENVSIMLNDFNGQKVDDTDGFENWLKTRFIELTFSDPNGFVVIEWDAVAPTETIKPRPFEVSSNEVINLEYKGAELQWLFIKSPVKYYVQDGEVKFKPDSDLQPIMEFPHKDNKKEGAVHILRMPEKDSSGKVPRKIS